MQIDWKIWIRVNWDWGYSASMREQSKEFYMKSETQFRDEGKIPQANAVRHEKTPILYWLRL